MNKEISFKKFLILLFCYLLFLSISLCVLFTKTKPFCKSNHPCITATCVSCESKNGKKECKECSLFNEKNERVWVGNCIYEE